jgi:hypothetical protein
VAADWCGMGTADRGVIGTADCGFMRNAVCGCMGTAYWGAIAWQQILQNEFQTVHLTVEPLLTG